MPNRPWDRPKDSMIPNRPGDRNKEVLYAGIGRVLHNWEGVEVALAELYVKSNWMEQPVDADVLFEEFALIKKAHDRASAVRALGEAFFEHVPLHYRAEGKSSRRAMKRTLSAYLGWVARRNDVAHGYITELVGPDYELVLFADGMLHLDGQILDLAARMQELRMWIQLSA